MKKNAAIIISILELAGLVVINFAIPAETTGQIIAKTAAGLIWISAYFLYRKFRSGKLNEKNDEK